MNRGYALEPGLPSIAAKAPWLGWQLAAGFAFGTLLFLLLGRAARRAPATHGVRNARRFLIALASACTLWLLAWHGWEALKVTLRVDRNKADWIAWDHLELGKFAREHLPPNAVLLFRDDRFVVPAMFHADRTGYGLRNRDLAVTAASIRKAGGEPFLVTPWRSPSDPAPGPALFEDWTGAIYRLP